MNLIDLTQRIRTDRDLGEGSCSHVDECFTDTELTQLIRETIDEIRENGRRPSYKAIREILYDKEVLWWETEGIKWPHRPMVDQKLSNIGYGSSEALKRH